LFSNWGSSVDAQGWGAEITTLAYGDLQGGPDEDIWYTSNFGGTSGAAAVVAGVVASLQGLELGGPKRPPLTPADVRRLLRQSGSPQQDGPSRPATQRVGTRPDLMALMALLAVAKDEAKDAKDAKTEKNESKDTKDAKNETKEQKDGKDEAKERKDNKSESKDRKDDKTEKNERKDAKDDNPDKLIPVEQIPFAPEGVHPPVTAALRSDEPVRHFIPDDLRPTLNAAALTLEPDFLGRDAAELADELRPPTDVPAGS
jgi:hypothetical protein